MTSRISITTVPTPTKMTSSLSDYSSLVLMVTSTWLPMLATSELKPRFMRVQKHSEEGNQMSITLPSEFAKILSIDRGDTVKVTLDGKRIVVEATK